MCIKKAATALVSPLGFGASRALKAMKPPGAPAVTEDPLLKKQIEDATRAESARRSSDKQSRLETALGLMSGGFGRRSLIRGSRGGAGFAGGALRSLFVKG